VTTVAQSSESDMALPALVLRRRDGDRHSYQVEKREDAEGVTASYHDRDAAERKDVTIGKRTARKAKPHLCQQV